jgi:hypothetical protein
MIPVLGLIGNELVNDEHSTRAADFTRPRQGAGDSCKELISEVTEMRQTRPPRRQEGRCEPFDSAYRAGSFVTRDALNGGLEYGGHGPIKGLVRLAFDRDTYDP